MMKNYEEWIDIEGYENLYQVSNTGKIKSLKRTILYENTNQTGISFCTRKECEERILKLSSNRGYQIVALSKDGQRKTYQVHRLVALHFLPNPNNLPCINHKDENKKNNNVDNLEWCTEEYNNNYGTRNTRIVEKLKEKPEYYKPVICYDLQNNYVKTYSSAVEAGKSLGIAASGITACCKLYKGRATAAGYKWKYKDSDVNIETIMYKESKKKLLQFSMDGQYINTYDSLSAGARAMNKEVANFKTAVKKGIAYNFLWTLDDDYSKIENLMEELSLKEQRILQIDTSGNVINRFKSAVEAQGITGLNNANISYAIESKTKEGKQFRKCGGYYWVDVIKNPNYQIDFNYKKGHGEKGIVQCDIDGNEINEFDSVADAQEHLGMKRNKISSIYDCLRPNSKKEIAYGYKWKKKCKSPDIGENYMKQINVVAAVIVKDNKIYATQRGYGEFKDYWEFPGGKVEPHESLEDALKREIKEELDTIIEVKELIKVIDYDYPSFHLHLSAYKCNILEGNLTLLEAEDAKWLSKDELYSINWLPADLSLIDELVKIME